MAFKMVNPEHGNFERKAKRGCHACAYEQRARESRTPSVCDGIQVLQCEAGFGKYLPDEGQQPPDVIAGGEFRNHSTIFSVHFGLGI